MLWDYLIQFADAICRSVDHNLPGGPIELPIELKKMMSGIGKGFGLIIITFTDNVNLIWTKMIPNGCRAYKKAPTSVQVCIGVTTFATMTPGVVAGGIGTYYWAINNPTSAISILETVNDIFNNSMPPTSPIGQTYFIYDKVFGDNK